MDISILCDSEAHPVNDWLLRWMDKHSAHNIQLVREISALPGGEILFIISCSTIVPSAARNKYQHALVLHASDLPDGRGWSPHIWAILKGDSNIVVSMLEAEDKVDTGRIWHKVLVSIPPHALYDEINSAIFDTELALMDFALENADHIQAIEQGDDSHAVYFPRRTPEDSQLAADKSIAEQFNLLRVSDPQRYPAFFDLHGHRYYIKIVKDKSQL